MNAARFGFPRSRRLSGQGAFKAVMDARVRADCPAFSLHSAPSTAPDTRIGISIGRRVGTAATRNRIKRLVREAFRLSQELHPRESPAPYDLVVAVRPHQAMPLEEYRRLLLAGLAHVDAVWRKRAARRAEQEEGPP